MPDLDGIWYKKYEYNAVRQWDFRDNLFIEGLNIMSLPEIAFKCVKYNRMTI